MTTSDGVPEMVDWNLAVATATRLVGSGPNVSEPEAHGAVADLRRFSAEAEAHVREFTGLDGSSASAPVVIVDRPGWAKANADSMRTIIAPLEQKLSRRRGSGLLDSVGPKVTALETGALLAFLAGKVLGQFDPFWTDADADGAAVGRLLLVAPNVVHVERELDVVPRDFRLWVCLHEETHRVQFTAVPWLRDHLRGEIETFVEATEVDPGVLVGRARELIRALVDNARSGGNGPSLLDLIQTPGQKAVVERVTAVMSLLEGHADVVMDGVGPDVVGTVETIRRRFQKRRSGTSGLDRTLRRLLGLDAKMRQYRDGAAFVNGVVERVGNTGFNRVWESPVMLPSQAEIGDPAAWVRRVHGGAPELTTE